MGQTEGLLMARRQEPWRLYARRATTAAFWSHAESAIGDRIGSHAAAPVGMYFIATCFARGGIGATTEQLAGGELCRTWGCLNVLLG